MHLAQLEEGQYFKQLDDITTDLISSLDSTLNICNTLKGRHAQFKAYIQAKSPPTIQNPGGDLGMVAEGLEEKIVDLNHYRLQAESLRSKVRSAANLVRNVANYARYKVDISRLQVFWS